MVHHVASSSSAPDNTAALAVARVPFPWRASWQMLRERFAQDRIAFVASSLAFATLTALVPLMAVVLSVFTAFPMFDRLQGALQQWLVASLMPRAIVAQVSQSVAVFASNAAALGAVGMLFFVVTAFALFSAVNTQFNAIWRVRKARALGQRLLLYWAALSIGPLLLGGGIAAASYLLSLSQGWTQSVPLLPHRALRALFDGTGLLVMTVCLSAMYHFVPHARVRWAHAFSGGVFAACGLALAQALLGWYLRHVPSYSVIYGTFATVPILLLWLYVVWMVVLLGAVVAAYLPSVLNDAKRQGQGAGWTLQLAAELLRTLDAARAAGEGAVPLQALSRQLHASSPHLEAVLEELAALRWCARLDEPQQPWALLVDLQRAEVQTLLAQVLRSGTHSAALAPLWRHPIAGMTLAQWLCQGDAATPRHAAQP